VSNRRGSSASGSAEPWRSLVLLLMAAVFLHALDRSSLSLAADAIRSELKLSNTQMGMLLSAFFWTFVPAQLAAALAIRRFGAFRTLAAGLLLWSTATAATSLANGMMSILVFRLAIGFAEAATFPASAQLIAANVPRERFGLANGSINAGLMLGNAASALLSGAVLVWLGWRYLFVVFGCLSVLWFVGVWRARPRVIEVAADRAGGGFRPLLSRRDFWVTAFGQFATNYPYFLIVTWLPLFLIRKHGYSTLEMAALVTAFFVASAAMGLGSGIVADRMISAGHSITVVRKGMILAACIVGAGCMILCAQDSPRLAVVGVLCFSLASGLSGASLFAITQTLAGPKASGDWMALQNAFGSLSGIAAPLATGIILDRTGEFAVAFYFAALMLLTGFGVWLFGISRLDCVVQEAVGKLGWPANNDH
jgi:MFS family permease